MPMPSRATFMAEFTSASTLLAACLALAGARASAQEAVLQATTSEPRAYGHLVGDLVERNVTVHVPPGLVLDPDSVPRPSARGKSIELKTVQQRSQAEAGGMRHELQLVYQVFRSPPEVRTLEIAPFVLRFKGQPRDQDLRVDAWPVTMSPLAPVNVSPRTGLGELRPDLPPPLIDTRAGRWRLASYGALLTLLLGYLAHVYLALPWRARRHRPFARAWNSLRGLPANAPATEWRTAFQRMHEAVNQTAGEVLFEHSVDRFVAAHPRYAGLRNDLAEFFQRSRSAFFAPHAPADLDGHWLLLFCRRCRDAERGAA
jgi:mxaA protein